MKKLLCLSAIVIISIASTLSVHATDSNKSLDEVLKESNQLSSQSSSQASSQTNSPDTNKAASSKSFFDSLKKSTDLTEESEAVTRISPTLKLVSTMVVQFVVYGLSIGLVIKVLLDLVYITIPPSRKILANGYVADANGAMPNDSGMYGRGGFGGMGGFGGQSRFGGMGGFGGMSSGFGGMGMPMNNPIGGGAQSNQQQLAGKTAWVSDEAMNSVMLAKNVGPDGKSKHAIRYYASGMVVELILVPILLTLVLTGVLFNFGLLIGDALATFISGIGSLGGII